MTNIIFEPNWEENHYRECSFDGVLPGQFFVDENCVLYVKVFDDFAIEIGSGAQVESAQWENQDVWCVPVTVTVKA